MQKFFRSLLCILSFATIPLIANHVCAQNSPRCAPLKSLPKIKVDPDTLDFGRIRLGRDTAQAFHIRNSDTTTSLTLGTNPNISYYLNNPPNSSFSARDIPGSFGLNSSQAFTDSVHFKPFIEDTEIRRIIIHNSSNPLDSAMIFVRGIGVEPHLKSQGFDFGRVRVGTVSAVDSIAVENLGTDTTQITAAQFDTGDGGEFWLGLLRFVPQLLGYHRVGDSVKRFAARFTPDAIGKWTYVLRVSTLEEQTFDTLRGEGVEPLIALNPSQISFGTKTVPKGQTPYKDTTIAFIVTNTGGFSGQLDSITTTDTTHFSVLIDSKSRILNETLQSNSQIAGFATLHITEEGDFYDTVYLHNDTRYKLYPGNPDTLQRLILVAHVRTGPVEIDSANLGTISSCDPVERILTIHNPYKVTVRIDTIRFQGDTAGFAFGGKRFSYPITIAPDSTYNLDLRYVFPADSANGDQVLTLLLDQRQGNHSSNNTPLRIPTTLSLVRKMKLVQLKLAAPSYAPSANDITAFRLPISLLGPKSSVPELDSWTLKLHFSNDVFEPVGYDNSGTLTQVKLTDPLSRLDTNWDPVTRTFTLHAQHVGVSDPANAGKDLLFVLLVRAIVTMDTETLITPEFKFDTRPCAYALEPFTVTIPYANECGEYSLRNFMRGLPIQLFAGPASPNPIQNEGQVSFPLTVLRPTNVIYEVRDALGELISSKEITLGKGPNHLDIVSAQLPFNGTYFIVIRGFDAATGLPVRPQIQKITVLR